jgi:hypothetical protein
MLAGSTPAAYVAFDLLALGDEDLTRLPLAVRREQLAAVLADAGPSIHLTPVTTEPAVALRWFDQFEGAGLDGVVAKPLRGRYEPNTRAMLKVKHERTADVVVAGYRVHKTSTDERPLLGSLLLGLYDAEGQLRHVGVSASFTAARRAQLFDELQPLVGDDHPWGRWQEITASGERMPGGGSRWSAGKDLSFVPLRPERVVEVGYDHMEGERFRHTAQFKRWRPDRDPRSCTYEQLEGRRDSGSAQMNEADSYDVVLLVEQPLTPQDAAQVRGLHEQMPEQVRYHLLLPVEDAAARVESAMGTLSSGDALVAAPMMLDQDEVAQIQKELLDQARHDLRVSVAALEERGATAAGDLVTVDALVAKVKEVGAAEVIVLTRPHVVSEFFHLDWTSRARRKLGVPVLHLLEHETFDEQAGGPEGISGF